MMGGDNSGGGSNANISSSDNNANTNKSSTNPSNNSGGGPTATNTNMSNNNIGTARGYSGYHHNNNSSNSRPSGSGAGGSSLNHYHRGNGNVGGDAISGARQGNNTLLKSPAAPPAPNSGEQQQQQFSRNSTTISNSYRALGAGGIANTGSGGMNMPSTPYRGNVAVGGGAVGRGGGGGNNTSKIMGDKLFSNSSSAAAHREREMMIIYGGGGGNSTSGSGGGSFLNDFDGPNTNNSFPKHESDSFESIRSGNLNDSTGDGQLHKRKYHNPCRFTGHDHEWKDCPNNFRNKKKVRTANPGRGGAPGCDRVIISGGRGAHHHHSSGAAGGGTGFVETDKTMGHYGPASVQSSGGVDSSSSNSGGIGATIDRNAPFSASSGELGRGSLVNRVTSAGDRGYDVSSTLNGSRSKSFSEHPSQRGGNGGGNGGGRTSSSGNSFPLKPANLGDRQRTWHQGGERGGVDSGFTPKLAQQQYQLDGGDKGNNTADSKTFSPSSNKLLLEQQQRNHALHSHVAHQQHRQPQLAHQQQQLLRSSSTPSPIMSIKSERGYSFTPPAALNRSRSSGSENPGLSGGIMGNQDHRSNDAHLLSSPGEVCSAAKKVLSKENTGDSTGGQGTVETKEDGECVSSGGKSTAGTTPRSLISSPLFRYGSNVSEDIGANSSSKIDSLYADLATPSPWGTNRQFIAAASTIASPQCASPTSIRDKRQLTSPGEVLAAADHHIVSTSNSTSTNKGDSSTPSISDSSSTNKGDSSMPPPSPVSPIKIKNVLPSLTCSSLVEIDKIRKAENIVAAMVKLVHFNAFESANCEAGVGVPLPSKMQITRAMGVLETKIKLKIEAAEAVRKEVETIQIEEREEAERIDKMKKEEVERIAKEEEEQIQRLQNEHDALRAERDETMSKKLLDLTSLYEARKLALQEKRQAEVLRMKELSQSDIQHRVDGIESHLSSLNDQLREVKQQITELENIQKKREMSEISPPYRMSSYSAAVTATRPPKIIARHDLANDRTHTNTLDLPGKMSGLVASIIAQNQIIAKRSHLDVLDCITFFPDAKDESLVEDVTSHGSNEYSPSMSNQAWSNRARRVTGQFDALYTEPTEVPCYHENNESFIEIAPLIKECIRRKNEKLKSRWTMLAEHYCLRQMMYNEQTSMSGDISEQGGQFSLGASYDTINTMETSLISTPNSNMVSISGSNSVPQHNPGVRGNNPYRRPRRGISLGDVVRSDYEQEQIIAEIAAKEAMEKRIKEGGCALPRQRSWLENRLFASHDGFFGSRVLDPLADEEERRNINIWSDMEKCIFLDRFLQHPKDFRRIASFLKNKSTKDCIAFYYHSKKTVPYKHSLKEFMQRKKCKGDVVPWDATIQACLSMGAVIKAGTSPERPLKFILPESDFTYHTRNFHPMRLELFKNLHEIVSNAKQRDDGKTHLGKRKRNNWFILDVREKKFLGHGDIGDDHQSLKRNLLATKASAADITSDDGDSSHKVVKSKTTRVKLNKLDKGHSDVQDNRDGGQKHQNDQHQSHKPQKWRAKEKDLFFQALNKFGHDWSAIAEAVGTRTSTQVKNYFYDNKKTIAKQKEKTDKSETMLAKRDIGGKKSKTLKGEKTAELEVSQTDVSLRGISLSTERVSTTNSSNNSNSETESVLIAQQACREVQDEQYRQNQFHLHQQQHLDQLQQQQHFKQQQQHFERLMHQHRQEDLYRQQIQQEEMYRHHLIAQHAQQLQQHQLHAHHQSQQYHESTSQVGHQQLDTLRSLLALRNTDHLPHLHHQNQLSGYGNNGGGGQQQQQQQQQQHQHSDLERVYKAALAAGVPLPTLESALAATRGGGGQHQDYSENENLQHQAMSMELLRRLGYRDDHYQR